MSIVEDEEDNYGFPPHVQCEEVIIGGISPADFLDAISAPTVRETAIRRLQDVVRSRSPLHTAVFEGEDEDVTTLLQAGAAVNVADVNKATPLHYAAACGHKNIASKLIKAGSQLEAECIYGATPLHIASGIGGHEMVTHLLRMGAQVNRFDECNNSALHYAIYSQKSQVVQILIEFGADVHVKNSEGNTPLISALGIFDEISMVVSEVVAAANNMRPYDSTINVEDSLSMVERLINEIDPFTEDDESIEERIDKDFLSTVELLLKAGADPNDSGSLGFTALHGACYFKHPINIMQLLLNSGASVTSKNHDGDTPLHLACHIFHDLEAPSYKKQVDLLIRFGADVNARNKWNQTPLHMAVIYELYGCIVSLMSRGADINALDSCKRTPIRYLSSEAATEFSKIMTQTPCPSIKSYAHVIEGSNVIPSQTLYEVLISSTVKSEFPLFHPHIITVYTARKELWTKIYGVFAKMSPALPDECVDQICMHLTNKELDLFLQSSI